MASGSGCQRLPCVDVVTTGVHLALPCDHRSRLCLLTFATDGPGGWSPPIFRRGAAGGIRGSALAGALTSCCWLAFSVVRAARAFDPRGTERMHALGAEPRRAEGKFDRVLVPRLSTRSLRSGSGLRPLTTAPLRPRAGRPGAGAMGCAGGLSPRRRAPGARGRWVGGSRCGGQSRGGPAAGGYP